MVGKFYPLVLMLILSGCDNNKVFYGYVEAQLTMLSSPTSGKLEQLSVVKGDRVKTGAPIYALEAFPESDQVKAAKALMDQANADYHNLLVGKRPSEIEAIDSQIKATTAQIEYLETEFQRRKDLVAKKYFPKEEFDKTAQNLKVSRNQLKEQQANLVTAKLPARSDEIESAAWKLASAKANLNQAEWRLAQKTVAAPRDGLIFDTYFRVGERIPENRPIASLLVASDIKAVFFVPEPQLTDIKLKQQIRIKCDHCDTTYNGTIYYISPDAEYTPPVIYSNSARSKLVYRVEARISGKGLQNLHPGQPIDIYLDAH